MSIPPSKRPDEKRKFSKDEKAILTEYWCLFENENDYEPEYHDFKGKINSLIYHT